MLIPAASVSVMVVQGIGGVASYLIGALIVTCGVLLWLQPELRSFCGVAAVCLGQASFVTSNLGGFLLGMLLAIGGGSLGFAWAPLRAEPATGRARARRWSFFTIIPALAVLAAIVPGVTGRTAAAAAVSAPAQVSPLVSTERALLKAGTISMSGLSYHGVVTVATARGPVRALRFTLNSISISGMDQSVLGTVAIVLRNLEGKAEISGHITLDVTRISGTAFGLIPVTYTPDDPPLLTVPLLVLTSAQITIAHLHADQVHLPSLSIPKPAAR